MAERSQYQYTPIVGPVWREPVADRLAWLPRGQQPARTLPPNRLGDYARPEFAALYRPEGLQWLASDRYAGRPLPYALVRYTVLDPIPPAQPHQLDWAPRVQQPARGLPPNKLGDYVRPEFAALYRHEGLQWIPSERFPGRRLAPNKLGDFQQPPFASLYKSEGLQWIASDRYAGRALAYARNDWTVTPPRFAAPAYDPQNLEWIPQGSYPRVPVELRNLGSFAQPPFDALYKPAGLQWGVSDEYFGRALPYSLIRYTVLDPFPPAAPGYDPQNLEWIANNPYLSRELARTRGDTSVYPPQNYDPSTLAWRAYDSYSGKSLPRSRSDTTQIAFPAWQYDPRLHDWEPNFPYAGQALARSRSDTSLYPLQPPAAYNPNVLDWRFIDPYIGQSLRRAFHSWYVADLDRSLGTPTPPAKPVDEVTGGWLTGRVPREYTREDVAAEIRRQRESLGVLPAPQAAKAREVLARVEAELESGVLEPEEALGQIVQRRNQQLLLLLLMAT